MPSRHRSVLQLDRNGTVVPFLAASLFTHAGRPSVGIEPTRADIPFVHERLTRKESQAQKGSFFSFVGFVILLIVIL